MSKGRFNKRVLQTFNSEFLILMFFSTNFLFSNEFKKCIHDKIYLIVSKPRYFLFFKSGNLKISIRKLLLQNACVCIYVQQNKWSTRVFVINVANCMATMKPKWFQKIIWFNITLLIFFDNHNSKYEINLPCKSLKRILNNVILGWMRGL